MPGTQTRYIDVLPEENRIGAYPTDRQLRRAAVGRDVVDSEGRCLILEFPLFVLINVYCPARRNHQRTGYRNTFLLALDARIRNLAAMGKNVVLCGDLNTMRDQIDTAGIWGHQGQKVLTEALEFDEVYMSMRAPKLLNQLLFNSRQMSDMGKPFIDETVEKRRPPVLYDTCRELHPSRVGMFTCWDTRKNHRPANFGSRIDLIVCSPKVMQLVQEADIQPQLLGSDHCPVYIILREKVDGVDTGNGTYCLDYLNPPRRFVNGKLALTTAEDAALLKRFQQSGRRMPQFSNRRHIASMFRQVSKQPATQERPISPSSGCGPIKGSDLEDTNRFELPGVFKADVVELVDSSDDDDAGVIEDDDPDAIDEPDDESESQELTSAPLTKHEKQVPQSFFRSASLPNRSNMSLKSKGEEGQSSTFATSSTHTAGSASMDLPVLREDNQTATASTKDTSSQRVTSWRYGGSSSNGATLQLSRQSSVISKGRTKRELVRSRTGGSVSNSSAATASSSGPARPSKKVKTSTGGQTSMSMFLKSHHNDKTDSTTDSQPQSQHGSQTGEQSAQQEEDAKHDNSQADGPSSSTSSSPTKARKTAGGSSQETPALEEEPWMSAEEVDAAFKNLDAARASWSRLGLGQRQAPLCEHGEPCKTFVTKKAGVNSGRSFYMCARPPGPLGRREKGTAWQCTSFVWCRDWKPDRDATGGTSE